MRVQIVGGGPGGLFLAVLLKRLDASHRIVVHERNPADSTFGWGVVFSSRTLQTIEQADPEGYRGLRDRVVTWDNVDVVHRGENISILGNAYAGVERMALLKVLQARAAEVGVEVRYGSAVTDPGSLEPADLLVGADGVVSTVRKAYEREFEPRLDWRRNRYIWLGTPRLFHGLTLTFRSHEAGAFIAHSYKYCPTMSTFIVECREEAWKAAGLDAMPVDDAIRFLEGVFRDDLDGRPLLSNRSAWIQFALLSNRRWVHGNTVLLGDSCHTVHFSIGSGTKLAMEDAIALADAFRRNGAVADALAAYERERKPVVDEYQRAAHSSLVWFEEAREKMAQDPVPFAYDLMTRSTRVTHDNLRMRDPEFIRRVDAYRAGG